jgi:hypothetical protein
MIMAKIDIKIGNGMCHDDLAVSQSLANVMSYREYNRLLRTQNGFNNIIEWKLKCINLSRNNKCDFTIGKIYSLTLDGLETDNYTWKNFLLDSGDNPYEKWLNFVEKAQNNYGDTLTFELVETNNGVSVSSVHTVGKNLFDNCDMDINIPLRPVPVIDDRRYPLYGNQRESTPYEDTGATSWLIPNSITNGDFSEGSGDWNRINVDYNYIELEDSKMKDRVNQRYEELWNMWYRLQNMVDSRLKDKEMLDSLNVNNELDLEKLKSEIERIGNLLKGYSALNKMGITNIENDDPNTIVEFGFNGKVISKTSDDDTYDLEKGVLLALVKNSSSCADCFGDRTYTFEIFDAIDDFVNRREV